VTFSDYVYCRVFHLLCVLHIFFPQMVCPSQISVKTQSYFRLQALSQTSCQERTLGSYPSVCPNEISRLPPGAYSWKLKFVIFTKIYWSLPILAKASQNNSLFTNVSPTIGVTVKTLTWFTTIFMFATVNENVPELFCSADVLSFYFGIYEWTLPSLQAFIITTWRARSLVATFIM
jgi:hypothetical protein